jgi:hypothetical protein
MEVTFWGLFAPMVAAVVSAGAIIGAIAEPPLRRY